jgi:hypothetical protein
MVAVATMDAADTADAALMEAVVPTVDIADAVTSAAAVEGLAAAVEAETSNRVVVAASTVVAADSTAAAVADSTVAVAADSTAAVAVDSTVVADMVAEDIAKT